MEEKKEQKELSEIQPASKNKLLSLDTNDEAILKGIILAAADNVGKFGLSAEQVGRFYSNCHTFINVINSL